MSFDPKNPEDAARMQARVAEVLADEFGITEMYVGVSPGPDEPPEGPLAVGEGGIDFMLKNIVREQQGNVEPDHEVDQSQEQNWLTIMLAEAAYMQGGMLRLALIPAPLMVTNPDLQPCGCLNVVTIGDVDTGARIMEITPIHH